VQTRLDAAQALWQTPKRSESFDNDVFFDIEAKRICSIGGKFISERSEHVYIKEFKKQRLLLLYQSEANRFDSLKMYFEAELTCLLYIKDFKYRSEAK
jgi:hypothetical protein